MINNYIREATGKDFSRLRILELGQEHFQFLVLLRPWVRQKHNPKKKNVVSALDEVSSKLGNTRTIL